MVPNELAQERKVRSYVLGIACPGLELLPGELGHTKGRLAHVFQNFLPQRVAVLKPWSREKAEEGLVGHVVAALAVIKRGPAHVANQLDHLEALVLLRQTIQDDGNAILHDLNGLALVLHMIPVGHQLEKTAFELAEEVIARHDLGLGPGLLEDVERSIDNLNGLVPQGDLNAAEDAAPARLEPGIVRGHDLQDALDGKDVHLIQLALAHDGGKGLQRLLLELEVRKLLVLQELEYDLPQGID
mmetsp:Transcript_2009/g.7337  ORF Transcript_2009/g.7337 Transcript_2009/m.7337 type:complete len:243 (-) Transcript_2009:3147-3875(-)